MRMEARNFRVPSPLVSWENVALVVLQVELVDVGKMLSFDEAEPMWNFDEETVTVMAEELQYCRRLLMPCRTWSCWF